MDFGDYSIVAADSRGKKGLLVAPFALDLRVERNLSGARSHTAPDWRLAGRLQALSLDISLADYCLVKGILDHNLSGKDAMSTGDPSRSIILQRSSLFARESSVDLDVS